MDNKNDSTEKTIITHPNLITEYENADKNDCIIDLTTFDDYYDEVRIIPKYVLYKYICEAKPWFGIKAEIPKHVKNWLNTKKNRMSPHILFNKIKEKLTNEAEKTGSKYCEYDCYGTTKYIIHITDDICNIFGIDKKFLNDCIFVDELKPYIYGIYPEIKKQLPDINNIICKVNSDLAAHLKIRDVDILRELKKNNNLSEDLRTKKIISTNVLLLTETDLRSFLKHMDKKDKICIAYKELIEDKNNDFSKIIQTLEGCATQYKQEEIFRQEYIPEKDILSEYIPEPGIWQIIMDYDSLGELLEMYSMVCDKIIHRQICETTIDKALYNKYKNGTVEDHYKMYKTEGITEPICGCKSDNNMEECIYTLNKPLLDRITTLHDATKSVPKFYRNLKNIHEIESEDVQDDCIIKHDREIVFNNKSGYNKDERSCGDDNIADKKLYYKKYATGKKELTIREMMISIMMIKSSKTDFWYELHSDVTFRISEKSKKLMIDVSFDHGS